MAQEVADITPSELSAAILYVREEWLRKKKVRNLKEIGSGKCYEFSDAVAECLGLNFTHGSDRGVIDVHTEDFWTSDAEISITMLRRLHEPVPDDVPHRELRELIGQATHAWFKLGKLHYDAEAPHGVEHFLELPFFARQVAGLRAEVAARKAFMPRMR